MNKERELLKEACDLLDDYWKGGKTSNRNRKLFYEIKELLAQPEQTEQEAVAWLGRRYGNLLNVDHGYSIPLYTAPPKREPLSTKQAEDLWETTFKSAVPYYIFDEICGAIEQYHGIGDE